MQNIKMSKEHAAIMGTDGSIRNFQEWLMPTPNKCPLCEKACRIHLVRLPQVPNLKLEALFECSSCGARFPHKI